MKPPAERPYLSIIRDIVVDAVQESRKILSERPFSKTTRANAAHNLMVQFAKERLLQLPGVKHLDLKQRQLFLIENEWVLCFKKFNPKLQCSGIPTDQAEAYMGQESLPIDFTGEARKRAHLVAGYLYVNKTNTTFGVFLTCPVSRKSNLWVMPLQAEPGSAASGIVSLFPIAPQGQGGAETEDDLILPKLRRVSEDQGEAVDEQ